jgi:murein DD-endopeptidase MepM/ murein hydrolase activator NlpD
VTELGAPLEGKPEYPFTKNESINCGRWERNSQDFPYFGAPRGNARKHAGVDIYPQGGAGSPVISLADGVIIKIAPFYTRANGEVTYGVLVDHADFVANYAELEKPDTTVSTVIKQGEIIGRVSGTRQLHFELYAKGTKDWLRWYGKQPEDLMDPTEIILKLFNK